MVQKWGAWMLLYTRKLGLFIVVLGIAVLETPLGLGEEWPQWRGPNRDGVWQETGVVESFTESELELRWRVPVGNGFSGPTVAGGRVYLTDRLTDPEELERVHCFDWETGDTLWSYTYAAPYRIEYPQGPRASVLVDEGRAYSLGAMGHLHCFDAASGDLLWRRDLHEEYSIDMPIWGIAASPIVWEDLLIVHFGGEEACLAAFDKVSGEERWRALNDRASYSAPILIEQAGRPVLVCLTGERVVGLDPASGELYWEVPFPPTRMVLHLATPVFDGDRLYFSSFYDGSLMLRVHPDSLSVEEVWRKRGMNERNTEALHSIVSTPILLGEYIYGVDSYGELRCLDAAAGERIWEDQTAVPYARWATIHMVRNADKVWMFNELGELIISELSPEGFHEISRAKLIEPTMPMYQRQGRGVCWSHPAFAYQHVFVRNDQELVCASLAKETQSSGESSGE